jgi:Spy/CpxP family protein refolding chaperone
MMSNQYNPARPDLPPPVRRRRNDWLVVSAVAIAAALSGAAATHAVGQQPWHGPGFMSGPFDPAAAEERADRVIRHLAVEADATPDQQEKLRGIVKGAVKDLLPMREKAQLARERARILFTQPAIDRAQIETLRSEQLALADAASRRFTQALADAAEVLAPEQRRKLDARVTELRERWGFWRGWRRG